jgi:NAD-dependent deacetylase
MKLATPEAFADDPKTVHAFYNARRRQLLTAGPNTAHFALATLGRALAAAGGRLSLVTQNVDDLHERSGSISVLHMHGALRRARCTHCDHAWACDEDLSTKTICPACAHSGGARPDVVWFGEMPMFLDEIADALATAELFVAIGTSGAVYPAAGFVAEAAARGIATLELNLARSDVAGCFAAGRYGPAGVVVPAWVQEIEAALAD